MKCKEKESKMSVSFVRPFTTNPLYSISVGIDDDCICVYNSNDNDTSWHDLSLSDSEFMQAFKIICSAEFDNYLMYRNETTYCYDESNKWFDKIAHGIDNSELDAALHNLVYYSKMCGSYNAKAEYERHGIITRTSHDTWRNACKIYCAMYGAEYDVIRTV
jgi:hypothetical protein